jgi:hypothetical protein
MRILSFDQAPSHTGWAYGRPGEMPVTGYRDMPDYGEAFRPMWLKFKPWLNDLLDKAAPRIVTTEQLLQGKDWRVMYRQFSLVAAIEVVCAERGIDVYDIEVKDWRNKAGIPTRRPKWAKDDVEWLKNLAMERCRDRGWKVPNHHAAEAALMLEWAWEHWS